MKAILQNLNYAAPYPGNLMRSLWALENKCKYKYSIIYLFPKSAKDLYWVNEMIERGCRVYFKSDDKSDFSDVILSIVNKYNVKIIHTHFYSIVEYKIMHKVLDADVKLVLHQHGRFMFYIPKPNKSSIYNML